MTSRALGLWMASGLLISGALTAEPLTDLRARMAALRNAPPIRLKVEIERKHSESAPGHKSSAKQTGRATIVYGPKGVQIRGQRTSGSSQSSSWGTDEECRKWIEIPMLDMGEASLLVDPATVLYYLLWDATLLRDEPVTWQGQAARLLVFVPTSVGVKAASFGAFWRFTGEVKIWLSDGGMPLAMQHALRPNVEETTVPGKRDQLLIFQEVDGRLLAARTEDTFSGTQWETGTLQAAVDR